MTPPTPTSIELTVLRNRDLGAAVLKDVEARWSRKALKVVRERVAFWGISGTMYQYTQKQEPRR